MRCSLSVIVVCALAAIVPVAQGSPVSLDFNSDATSFTGNFLVENNGTANTGFTWTAGVGVQDQPGPAAGGAVVYSANDITASYNSSSFDLTAGTTTESAFLKLGGAAGGTDKALQLGFMDVANRSFNGELADTAFMSFRIFGNGTVEFQSKPLAGGTGAVGLGSITLNQTDWLKASLILTPTNAAAGTYNYQVVIEDWGTTGTSKVSTLLTSTVNSITVGAFSTGVDGKAAFAGFRTTTGAPAIDNFSVTPEPASMALLALGALGLLRRRK
jgi:MYXO-CTERM domain-containing protein